MTQMAQTNVRPSLGSKAHPRRKAVLHHGGSSGDLDAEVAGAAVVKEGRWEADWLARTVRNVLPEDWAQRQLLITIAWGASTAVSRHPRKCGGWREWGVREAGKVRGTDRLEKSTCPPRVRPPFRHKLSGRKCGCRHSNSSSS